MDAPYTASDDAAYEAACSRNDYERSLDRATQSDADRITDLKNSIARYEEAVAGPDWMFGLHPERERATYRRCIASLRSDLAFWEARVARP